MGKLHYVSVMSLDGYIGDDRYDWSLPAEGSTAFITDVIRPFGIYLYGRKNYETMSFWETTDVEKMEEHDREFARVWQSARKVVYSKTLDSVKTKNTRLENDFEAQKVRDLKEKSSTDLCIGGPTIAGLAIRHNLVDEIHLFVVPTTIGNEIPVIPVLPRDTPIRLDLLEERRFSKSWAYLHYRIQP